jgi:hypothetical protein
LARKKFPFIGTTEGLVDGDHWRRMGKARGLFDFFVKNQNDPDGQVFHGRPITYAWMCDQIENSPPARTIRRYAKILESEGYIALRVVRTPHHQGIAVRILNPKKWATQLRLFPSEKPLDFLSKSRGIPVTAESTGQARSGQTVRPQVAVSSLYRKESDIDKRKTTANLAHAEDFSTLLQQSIDELARKRAV